MTESEEMYLVTIARLKENGQTGPVALSSLAAELDVLPVSANQMIRKLEDAGWVSYTPYHGVELTGQGEQLALQVLRHRRLWEVFLVELLKIAADEAGSIACRMEHLFPAGAAERLAEFLGHPATSPGGLPIPEAQSGVFALAEAPLSALMPGDSRVIARISADPAARSFFSAEGLLPGETIRVIAVGATGALLLQTRDGRSLHLSAELARTIWVHS